MLDLETTNHEPASPKRSMWPTLLLVAVLLLSAAGIIYLFTSTPDGAETVEAPPTTAEASDADPTGEPVPVFEPDTAQPSAEPVADAAEVILPSVVQILTNGGVGSGVIYDADGLILTAAHVVEGNSTVTVRLPDGEEIEGAVIGGNAEADVAVVQVERTGLPAATLALDDEPRVGQMAIAVGSPWGLSGTVTAGIVSAVNQTINCEFGSCQAMLQTDAAINPGNSGGALVDRQGRVIGINVSIFTLSGANDGVGFAVPIDFAYDVADRLVAGESIDRAYLGVSGIDVESGEAGALIEEVVPGSGADEAGILVGDVVLELDGVEVQGIRDLAAQVAQHRPGSTVDVLLLRNGEELTVQATLGVFVEE